LYFRIIRIIDGMGEDYGGTGDLKLDAPGESSEWAQRTEAKSQAGRKSSVRS